MSAAAATTLQPPSNHSVADIFESMSYGPAPESDDVAQVRVVPLTSLFNLLPACSVLVGWVKGTVRTGYSPTCTTVAVTSRQS